MKINIEDLPNILVGEDAERFKEAIENVVPVSKEELKQAEDSYKLFRKMGAYTVDDLKCCGNCNHFKYIVYDKENSYGIYVCDTYNIFIPSYSSCAKWEFDGLIKNERF